MSTVNTSVNSNGKLTLENVAGNLLLYLREFFGEGIQEAHLDPLTTIMRIASLYFRPEGTKLKFDVRSISFDLPNSTQGIVRRVSKSSRSNVTLLKKSIEDFVKYYNLANQSLRTLAELAIKGLEKFSKCYSEPLDNPVSHCLEFYASILKKALENQTTTSSVASLNSSSSSLFNLSLNLAPNLAPLTLATQPTPLNLLSTSPPTSTPSSLTVVKQKKKKQQQQQQHHQTEIKIDIEAKCESDDNNNNNNSNNNNSSNNVKEDNPIIGNINSIFVNDNESKDSTDLEDLQDYKELWTQAQIEIVITIFTEMNKQYEEQRYIEVASYLDSIDNILSTKDYKLTSQSNL